MKNIGFIGLGVMGAPMAGHISNAGYSLKVFNRTREKSELWSEEYSGEVVLSPAELAEGCDIVFLCVGNNQDVEEIVQGKNELNLILPFGLGFKYLYKNRFSLALEFEIKKTLT